MYITLLSWHNTRKYGEYFPMFSGVVLGRSTEREWPLACCDFSGYLSAVFTVLGLCTSELAE